MENVSDRPRPAVILDELTEDLRLGPVWRAIDKARSKRAKIAGWPRWCYCPSRQVTMAVGAVAPLAATHIAKVGMLAAWRPTQGIYRFHSALLDTLWKAMPEGELTPERFGGLPEWCVYIEIDRTAISPTIDVAEDHLYGVFVSLDVDVWEGQSQLSFMLDYDHDLFVVGINLVGTFDESLRASQEQYRNFVARMDGLGELDVDFDRERRLMPSLVSLVLELCSPEVDIRAADGSERRPMRLAPRPAGRSKVRSRAGRRRPQAPRSPTLWDVRIGGAQ